MSRLSHKHGTAKQAAVLQEARLQELVYVEERPEVYSRVVITGPMATGALILPADLQALASVAACLKNTHSTALAVGHPLRHRNAHLLCNQAEVTSHIAREEVG